MPLLENLDFEVDVDQVLRAQGADPAILRNRRQDIVRITEQALGEGISLLQPRVTYTEWEVEKFQHETLKLAGNERLKGAFVSQQLAQAEKIIIIVCTIGERLERRVNELFNENMVYSMALYGTGSAAVESLANAACAHFETLAASEGKRTTIPFSPGMGDWSVIEGQPQIFRLLRSEDTGVTLTAEALMIPYKSLTMVLGVGFQVNSSGRTCDYCSLKNTCRYQNHSI